MPAHNPTSVTPAGKTKTKTKTKSMRLTLFALKPKTLPVYVNGIGIRSPPAPRFFYAENVA
jgi:hypothetical protein